MEPLDGLLVVDCTRYIPGPYASRELLRHGARVVRLESPDGDPLRTFAPEWEAALNAGKESVVCDLKAEPELGRALCSRADVVLESFRPGVAERLGIGAADLPDTIVYCSFSGFGHEGPHRDRAGHDLNYAGYAGLLADTAPALPPVQIADLAGGALAGVAEILAALLARDRTGRGARIEISITHHAHRLVAHRLGEPPRRLLTGDLACYGIYATSDGRHLTVSPLEPRFFERLCALVERPDLVERQYDFAAQDTLRAELGAVFETRPLEHWLELFEGEDVGVGPVATVEEAAREFGEPAPATGPPLGEHTDAWRRELGLSG